MKSRNKDFSFSMPLDRYFDGDDGSTERDEELLKQILAYKTDPSSHIPDTYLEDDVKNAAARRMDEVLRTPPWMQRVDVPPSVNERMRFKVKSPSEAERVSPSVKNSLGPSLVNLEWLKAEELSVFCHEPTKAKDHNRTTQDRPMEIEDKQIPDLGLTAEEEADCDDEYLKMKTNEPQSHTPVSLGNDPPLPSPNKFGVLRTPSRCVNTDPLPGKGFSKETKSDDAETEMDAGPVSGSGEHYPDACIDKGGEYETEVDSPQTVTSNPIPGVANEDKPVQLPRLVITLPAKNAPQRDLPLSPLSPLSTSSNDEQEDNNLNDIATRAKVTRAKSKVSKAKGKNKENKEKRDMRVGVGVAGSQSASGMRRTRSMTRRME